jgi:general secretion pathway protein H
MPRRPGLLARSGCGSHARGVTLFEVLIVVGLIALLSGSILFGSGFFTSARQRAAVTLIVSSIRLGITRANTTGQPVRLVFDLNQGRLILEETASRTMLRVKGKKADLSAGAEAASPEEQIALEEAKRIMDGPQPARPAFAPVKEFSSDAPNSDGAERSAGRPLGKGVKFRQIQTDHDAEPRKEGRAYLYFWPRGGTERASIQLQREGSKDDQGVTIMVSALTGRVKVEPKLVDLPEAKDEEGYSEREEETP